jgi:hypothetical protein
MTNATPIDAAQEGILTNEKGLFCSPEWRSVLTVTAHQRLTDWLSRQSPEEVLGKNKLRYQEAARVLALIATLPRKEVWYNNLLPGDAVKSVGRYGTAPCYAVMSLSTPSNKSSDKGKVTGGPREWGWDILQDISVGLGAKGLKFVAEMAEPETGAITLPSASVVTRVAKHRSAFQNGEITLSSSDPTESLSAADAAVIYLNGGYVDKHDRSGAIGGARLFESPAAAMRTARAHGWTGNCLIALVRVELVGLDASADHHVKNSEPLMAAIAEVERKALRRALQRASVDDLKEQLADREAGTSTDSTDKDNCVAEEPATPLLKRRM